MRNFGWILFTTLVLASLSSINGQPFTKIPLNCNSVEPRQFNDATRATLYGDSRMDYAQFYHPQDMDFFLGAAEGGWNVQNFGTSGWESTTILDYLRQCLQPKGDLTGPLYGNYKIHQNVAFHAGGNDYIWRFRMLLTYMPWKFPNANNYVANNYERIISMLQRRGKNVLLTGHYPTISNSIKLGNYRNYYRASSWDGPSIVPGGGTGGPTQAQEIVDYVKTNWTVIEDAIKIGTGSIFGHASVQPNPYMWWVTVVADDATIASLGMLQLDPMITEMQVRRSAYMNIDYLYIWPYFMWPNLGQEPWVANPNLMVDRIHPNPLGLQLWGKVVGDKMRALGWPSSQFSVANQSLPVVNDTPPAPGENTGRDENTDPSAGDLVLACFLLGLCKI